MKRILSTILTILLITQAMICTSAQDIRIIVNGKEVIPDSPAVIVDDRTLVPIRAVAEELGYKVFWNEADREVELKSEKLWVSLVIDLDTIFRVIFMPGVTRQESHCIPVAPRIINDRTYLPLRAVGEAMNCEVLWEADKRTVILNSK